jgi:glutamate formiminotransferase
VSMNMFDTDQTPYTGLLLIKQRHNGTGQRLSVMIVYCSAKALIDCVEYFLRLEGFKAIRSSRIISLGCDIGPKS